MGRLRFIVSVAFGWAIGWALLPTAPLAGGDHFSSFALGLFVCGLFMPDRRTP